MGGFEYAGSYESGSSTFAAIPDGRVAETEAERGERELRFLAADLARLSAITSCDDWRKRKAELERTAARLEGCVPAARLGELKDQLERAPEPAAAHDDDAELRAAIEKVARSSEERAERRDAILRAALALEPAARQQVARRIRAGRDGDPIVSAISGRMSAESRSELLGVLDGTRTVRVEPAAETEQLGVTPDHVHFDHIELGSISAPIAITFFNAGKQPITIDALAIEDARPGEFDLITRPARDIVADGEPATVEIAYRPSAAGPGHAKLRLTGHTAKGRVTRVAHLRGTAAKAVRGHEDQRELANAERQSINLEAAPIALPTPMYADMLAAVLAAKDLTASDRKRARAMLVPVQARLHELEEAAAKKLAPFGAGNMAGHVVFDAARAAVDSWIHRIDLGSSIVTEPLIAEFRAGAEAIKLATGESTDAKNLRGFDHATKLVLAGEVAALFAPAAAGMLVEEAGLLWFAARQYGQSLVAWGLQNVPAATAITSALIGFGVQIGEDGWEAFVDQLHDPRGALFVVAQVLMDLLHINEAMVATSPHEVDADQTARFKQKMFGVRKVVEDAGREASERAPRETPPHEASVHEQVAHNRAIAAEARTAVEQDSVRVGELVAAATKDGHVLKKFAYVINGNGPAAAMDANTLPGAGPRDGELTQLPEALAVGAGKHTFAKLGDYKIGQNSEELGSTAYAMQPSEFAADRESYAPASAITDATSVTQHRSGVPILAGTTVAVEWTRDESWQVPDARARITVRTATGDLYLYADNTDFVTGPGAPRKLLPTQIHANPTVAAEYQERLEQSGRLVYGDDPSQQRGGRVCVSGGGGVGAWAAKIASTLSRVKGAIVDWIAQRVVGTPTTAIAKAEFEQNRQKIESGTASPDELDQRQKELQAFDKGMLPRNVTDDEGAFQDANIHRFVKQIASMTPTEDLGLPGNQVKVTFDDGSSEVYDQVVVAHGPDPSGSSALTILKDLAMRPVIVDGKIVALESIDPPGAIRVLGSAMWNPGWVERMHNGPEKDAFIQAMSSPPAGSPSDSPGIGLLHHVGKQIPAANAREDTTPTDH